MKPAPIKQRKPIERRLRVASSVSKPQQVLAALYIIWRGTNKLDLLEYTDPAVDATASLRLDNNHFASIQGFWASVGTVPADFKTQLEATDLFVAQIEPLRVLFDLFWKFAKLSFVNEGHGERTGELRYRKKLHFTSNMDVLDIILSDSTTGLPSPAAFELLKSWLAGTTAPNSNLLSSIKRYLTILSEDTWFDADNIQFLQENIYEALIANPTETVLLDDVRGPLRILRSVISENIHTVLRKNGRAFEFNRALDDEIRRYVSRVSNYLDVTAANSQVGNPQASKQVAEQDPQPKNLILYGAPGTGKSYILEERANALNPQVRSRVTFYSDYSYSQFVGGYKPVGVYVVNEGERTVVKDRTDRALNRPGQPTVEYSFVPGPLLDMYVKAKKQPTNSFLIIIEELNRADAAAVFGDFFQLLDRDAEGNSVYSIRLTSEAQQYLKSQEIEEIEIKLPPNLYIWATLNSADQGVFPIDTAFKRRWSFEYLPLNQNEAVTQDWSIRLSTKNNAGELITVPWNALREKINNKLASLGIQEDLMIGPFFLNAGEMADDMAFKHKLIAYLRDDILRHQHGDFFSISGTLSQILQKYDSAQNIFSFDL